MNGPRPKRLLYVLERYPELSQTFVAREIEALIELGCEVEVVALSRGEGGEMPAPAQWSSDTAASRRVGSALVMAGRSPSATLAQLVTEREWPPPGGRRRLRGLLRLAPMLDAARAADHLHAHFATEAADVARLLAAASGRPWSFSAHGADAYADRAQLERNLAAATFARACSPHVLERLRAASPPDGAQLVEIPIAVDTNRFATCTGPETGGPIVAVGRLVEKKGFDDLIAAFSLAGPAVAGRELLIVGEGPLRPRLETLISETGVAARLMGALPNDHVASLLSGASLFALTPRTADDGDRDGRPAAIVEAMAAGLPILSTSQPGIPELVGNDCGALAEPGDVASVAAAMRDLAGREADELRNMGLAGRERVRSDYSPTAVAGRLLAEISSG